jgi:hypothetical protein
MHHSRMRTSPTVADVAKGSQPERWTMPVASVTSTTTLDVVLPVTVSPAPPPPPSSHHSRRRTRWSFSLSLSLSLSLALALSLSLSLSLSRALSLTLSVSRPHTHNTHTHCAPQVGVVKPEFDASLSEEDEPDCCGCGKKIAAGKMDGKCDVYYHIGCGPACDCFASTTPAAVESSLSKFAKAALVTCKQKATNGPLKGELYANLSSDELRMRMRMREEFGRDGRKRLEFVCSCGEACEGKGRVEAASTSTACPACMLLLAASKLDKKKVFLSRSLSLALSLSCSLSLSLALSRSLSLSLCLSLCLSLSLSVSMSRDLIHTLRSHTLCLAGVE